MYGIAIMFIDSLRISIIRISNNYYCNIFYDSVFLRIEPAGSSKFGIKSVREQFDGG